MISWLGLNVLTNYICNNKIHSKNKVNLIISFSDLLKSNNQT